MDCSGGLCIDLHLIFRDCVCVNVHWSQLSLMNKMEIDPLAPTQREKTVAEARQMGKSGLGSVDKEQIGISTVSASNPAHFSLRF